MEYNGTDQVWRVYACNARDQHNQKVRIEGHLLTETRALRQMYARVDYAPASSPYGYELDPSGIHSPYQSNGNPQLLKG